jgi:hypothetical protein
MSEKTVLKAEDVAKTVLAGVKVEGVVASNLDVKNTIGFVLTYPTGEKFSVIVRKMHKEKAVAEVVTA